MSLLQSYEIKRPIQQLTPLEHYKGKPTAHGYAIGAVPQVALSYVDPTSALPGSGAEQALLIMVAMERSFQTAATHIPVSLSISKQPRAPMSWNVTYLFPQGEVTDYCSKQFEQSREALAYDPIGVLTWQLQAELGWQPFGRHDGLRAILEGFSLANLQFTLSATTDFDIPFFDTPEGVLTEGLNLAINPHTLSASVTKTEDVTLQPVWQYSWTFGVN